MTNFENPNNPENIKSQITTLFVEFYEKISNTNNLAAIEDLYSSFIDILTDENGKEKFLKDIEKLYLESVLLQAIGMAGSYKMTQFFQENLNWHEQNPRLAEELGHTLLHLYETIRIAKQKELNPEKEMLPLVPVIGLYIPSYSNHDEIEKIKEIQNPTIVIAGTFSPLSIMQVELWVKSNFNNANIIVTDLNGELTKSYCQARGIEFRKSDFTSDKYEPDANLIILDHVISVIDESESQKAHENLKMLLRLDGKLVIVDKKLGQRSPSYLNNSDPVSMYENPIEMYQHLSASNNLNPSIIRSTDVMFSVEG